ncbi:TonB-dependent receptor [Acinetobacter sp. ANC 4636]
MSFIRTRKKIVSSAIVSSLSLMATTATIAADETAELPTIYSHAVTTKDGFKVKQSANKKYVAPLLDTPKSVAVISQKLLKDTNSNTLLQALANEPGITLGAGEGGTPFTDMPYIRGYSSQSSIYVDGIRNTTSQNRDMFAIEQVEVTKGSSSSISGGGGVGGSINLISKVAHQGDKYQGSIQGGTDNYRHIMLDANKDFGNGVAGRVVVMGHQNDKPGAIDGAEYNRVGIAPSLAWGLGTATRGTLSYYYLQSYDEPDSGIPFLTTGGKPIYVKQGTYYGWKNRDFDKRENHIGTFKLEHDFNDNLTLSNTASYTKSKSDYVYTNPDDSKGNIAAYGTISRRALSRIVDTDAVSDQLALTGKFNTGSLQHSFNIGTEWSYQSSEQGVHTFTNSLGTTSTVHSTDCSPTTTNIGGWCTSVNNPTNGLYTDTLGSIKNQYTTRSTNAAVYALDSIEFNPQWLLNLGVRWDQFDTERKYYKNTISGSTTIPAGTVLQSDSNYFSYQVGLVFKPAENGSIYASFATSANPVGIDQGDGADSVSASYDDLKPEEARTVELGTKWDLFNNRANLTAAVFRTEKQNTRVLTDANTYSNVGSSRVNGFEIDLKGQITDKWDMSAGYSYLDSELTKAAYNAAATVGKPLPFVAKNSATLWTTYKVLPKLTIGAGAQYKDQVYANTSSNKYLPAYTIYNAMAKYDVNKNVNIQLNVNNISNKRYFTSAQAAHYAIEGDGRNAVLAINFKY